MQLHQKERTNHCSLSLLHALTESRFPLHVALVGLLLVTCLPLLWSSEQEGSISNGDGRITKEVSHATDFLKEEMLVHNSVITTNHHQPSNQTTCDFRRDWKEKCEGKLSQLNQDCILNGIFDTIGITNKQCVEFGFGYEDALKLRMEDLLNATKKIGSGLNAQGLVVHRGFQVTFFDAEMSNENIGLVKAVLTEDNIVEEFRKAGIPKDVDYVSIDVDSVDVWLLHGLLKGGYRPRVISVEFNPNFPSDMPIATSRNWAPWTPGSVVYGSSAASLNYVAEKFGYRAVEMMKQLDMFFVREDILQEHCDNYSELASFESLSAKHGPRGKRAHKKCDVKEARNRLVHFPLALERKDDEARTKAHESIVELNRRRVEFGRPKYCPGFQ